MFQPPNKTAGTPAALAAIVFNRFTFAVKHTSESYNSSSARAYLINSIVEDFQRQVAAPRLVAHQRSTEFPTPPKPLLIASAGNTTPQTPSTLALPAPTPSTSSLTPTEAALSVSDPSGTPPTVQQ